MQFLCSYKWPTCFKLWAKIKMVSFAYCRPFYSFLLSGRSLTGSEAGGDLVLNDTDLTAFFV